MKRFALILPNGKAIVNKTVITNLGNRPIETEEELKDLIYKYWCKYVGNTSFSDWANEMAELHNDEEGGEFVNANYFDAVDDLANKFILNIEGEYIDLYQYFQGYNG